MQSGFLVLYFMQTVSYNWNSRNSEIKSSIKAKWEAHRKLQCTQARSWQKLVCDWAQERLTLSLFLNFKSLSQTANSTVALSYKVISKYLAIILGDLWIREFLKFGFLHWKKKSFKCKNCLISCSSTIQIYLPTNFKM